MSFDMKIPAAVANINKGDAAQEGGLEELTNFNLFCDM